MITDSRVSALAVLRIDRTHCRSVASTIRNTLFYPAMFRSNIPSPSGGLCVIRGESPLHQPNSWNLILEINDEAENPVVKREQSDPETV
jgi:hypothetical protein